MAEEANVPGGYTFLWPVERLEKEEFDALGNAEIAGIRTGYFDMVAHPDRIFRRRRKWTDEMAEMSRSIIREANAANIPLELNMHSLTLPPLK